MKLFDDMKRTDCSFGMLDESLFAYLNECASLEAARIRRFTEKWYEKFPERGQPGIRGEFRSGLDYKLQGAFFELVLHQLLSRMGCDVESHPSVEKVSTKPDFLARSIDRSILLEAKIVDPETRPFRRKKNEQKIIDILGTLFSPNFNIGVDFTGRLSKSFAKSEIHGKFSRLIEENDPDEVQEIVDEQGTSGAPFITLSDNSGAFTGRLYPIPARQRTSDQSRCIKVFPSVAHRMDTIHPIRSALKKKAQRYGKPLLPIVIAINPIDPYFRGREAEAQVLYGDQHYSVDTGETIRRRNGFWRNGFHSQVQAVWFFRGTDVLNLFSQPYNATGRLYVKPDLNLDHLPQWLLHLPYAKISVDEGVHHAPVDREDWIRDDLGL